MTRALAFAALLALPACSSAASGNGHTAPGLSGSITVDAASSLTEAFDSLKARFESAHRETKINISYGASSDLATQIQQGAPADVFASASEKNMQALGNQAVHPAGFVSNTLEIAVPPGNPAKIRSVADLAKPDVKVAVCDPAVPCGVVAAKRCAHEKNPRPTERDQCAFAKTEIAADGERRHRQREQRREAW